jgi:Hemolysins and related proteins containing CBS domains
MVSVPKQLLLQAFLILLNAFFAATEIAVISLSTTKLKKLEEEGDKKAGKLIRMVTNPSKFLSTIQIGITLAGFLGSAFAADALSNPLAEQFRAWGLNVSMSFLNNLAVVIITIILSFFTLVFGELVPKRIAQQKALTVAKFSLGVISVLSIVFKPLIWLISASTNLILRILHLKTESDGDQVSEEDIRLMVDAGGESGSIDEDEQTMIQNIFEFNDIGVYEIMTRQSEVIAFEITAEDEEILETIQTSGLSRFPVYEDDLNNILGVLNAREFLINRTKPEAERKSVKELLRPPTSFLSPSRQISSSPICRRTRFTLPSSSTNTAEPPASSPLRTCLRKSWVTSMTNSTRRRNRTSKRLEKTVTASRETRCLKTSWRNWKSNFRRMKVTTPSEVSCFPPSTPFPRTDRNSPYALTTLPSR